MLLFLYIYGTINGCVAATAHAVRTNGSAPFPILHDNKTKEVLMISVELKQEKHNALVSFLMIVIAILFLLYMGSSLVHSTKAFWKSCSIEKLLD